MRIFINFFNDYYTDKTFHFFELKNLQFIRPILIQRKIF
jgi:hypothetical protein